MGHMGKRHVSGSLIGKSSLDFCTNH